MSSLHIHISLPFIWVTGAFTIIHAFFVLPTSWQGRTLNRQMSQMTQTLSTIGMGIISTQIVWRCSYPRPRKKCADDWLPYLQGLTDGLCWRSSHFAFGDFKMFTKQCAFSKHWMDPLWAIPLLYLAFQIFNNKSGSKSMTRIQSCFHADRRRVFLRNEAVGLRFGPLPVSFS